MKRRLSLLSDAKVSTFSIVLFFLCVSHSCFIEGFLSGKGHILENKIFSTDSIIVKDSMTSLCSQLRPNLANDELCDEYPLHHEAVSSTYPTHSRRTIVTKSFPYFGSSLLLPSFLATFTTSPSRSLALDNENTSAQFLRKQASNVPGYGPPDVLFPPYFAGKWKMTRTMVPSDPQKSPITVEYPVRFVIRGGGETLDPSKNSEVVIADRAFNEMSFQNALLSSKYKVTSTTWDATNPNVLQLSFVDGSFKEIKVTKRAFNYEKTEDGKIEGLFSSEYRRITDVSSSAGAVGSPITNGIGGIPSISADRILTKWRKVEKENGALLALEGIELVYADSGAMGDPMGSGLSSSGGTGGPKIAMKSRLRIERFQDEAL